MTQRVAIRREATWAGAVKHRGPRSSFGTSGNEFIEGTAAGEVICGFGGADVTLGRGGNDILLGGRGSWISTTCISASSL